MQELYNFRNNLYPKLKERNTRLRTKLKAVQEENEQLRRQFKKTDREMEKMRLQIEELKEIAYAKKRLKRQKRKISLFLGRTAETEKERDERKKRTPGSYRRSRPSKEEVTDTVRFDLTCCPDCGGALTARKEHEHYREDLRELDELLEQSRQVVQRIHESGYCGNCKARKHALPLEKHQINQAVSIGHNARAMVVYLVVLMGMSYSEAILHLSTRYGIEVSEGEVANILQEQADLLRPTYQEMYRSLLEEPGCQYDESGWGIQKDGEGNYVWVKTGTESDTVLFWFGRSRGKGVAEKLRGEPPDHLNNGMGQVGVTDDYGAYRSLFPPGSHGLCWAHPHRKLRDLATSDTLNGKKQKHCQKVFQRFSDLYKKVREEKKRFDEGERPTETRIRKLEKELLDIAKPHKDDPDKLAAIKKSLTERYDRYFVCLRVPGIPLDNNKAERMLRKIVLKRKKSFGSKTQKGADALSILYSAVFSLIGNYPKEEFFVRYMEAIGGQ